MSRLSWGSTGANITIAAQDTAVRIHFNTTQAADYLHLSPGAVRNMVMRRQIPYRKVNGRLVFFKDELDRWMDSAPGVTIDELLNDRRK